MAKTLDLMKAVLQPSLNMEIKRLCDDYKQIFAMAATNIHGNTGDTVPPSTLQNLIGKMLEEVSMLGKGIILHIMDACYVIPQAHHGYAHGKWEFPIKKVCIVGI